MEKNTIILKILKRSMNIKKYFQFIGDTFLEEKKELSYLDINAATVYPFEKNIDRVEINEHSLGRWNSRVGPTLTIDVLEMLFNKLILLPHRIQKITEGIGIIDSDIIFTYEKVSNKLIVTTFYGRRSQNHSLYQIEALRGYNNFHNEQIMLNLEKHVLDAQRAPVVPMVFMEFEGVRTRYFLEGYRMAGKEQPVFLVHSFPGETMVIDLNENPKEHINKSILLALFLLRNRDFVWDYLRLHHSERVDKLLNR